MHILKRESHSADYPLLDGIGRVTEMMLSAYGQTFQFPHFDVSGFMWKKLQLNGTLKAGGELTEPGKYYKISASNMLLVMAQDNFASVKPVGIAGLSESAFYRITDAAGSVLIVKLRPKALPALNIEDKRATGDLANSRNWYLMSFDYSFGTYKFWVPNHVGMFEFWALNAFTTQAALQIITNAERYKKRDNNGEYYGSEPDFKCFLRYELSIETVRGAAALPKDTLIALYQQTTGA